MTRKNEKPEGVDRREFIAGAGTFVTGTASTLAAGLTSAVEANLSHPCRVLLHDPAVCAGCGTCVLMCALYHEGDVGPSLSRTEVARDPFSYEFIHFLCQQCRIPECYFACPQKDLARLIDEATGIVHVDENECIGCGSCVSACRFVPARTTMHPEKGVAINCDRCMNRAEGPVCVDYCTMNALTCLSVQPPRRINGRRRP